MMKTRFAPSPTGHIHLGNVRTALFCVLAAKSQQGTFLLRIEDTDRARSTNEFAEQLQADLRWLGLEWQEGPNAGGNLGPYFQSQRQAIYDEYYLHLEQTGHVYPCFCSEQQLAIARKVQLSRGQPPRYPGTCRSLTPTQVAEKYAQGLQPTIRFRVPDNINIEFDDYVRGPQCFASNDIGDFIIRRADGTPPFFFCNAIDDALMQITHVMRGEDHLANTPRQLLILQALALPLPHYGHISLILGPDHSPLSKRHGSYSVKEMREQGYLPQAVVNYLARLGHYYTDNNFLNLDQLAASFNFGALAKSPAHFDAAQLLHWQKQAVQHLLAEQLWQWLGKGLHSKIPQAKRDLFITTIQANITFPNEALHWADIFFADALEYQPDTLIILQQAGANFFQTALTALTEQGANFTAISKAIQQNLGIKGKALFQPLRVALTGQIDGPEMAKIFELLGKEKIRLRLENSIKII